MPTPKTGNHARARTKARWLRVGVAITLATLALAALGPAAGARTGLGPVNLECAEHATHVDPKGTEGDVRLERSGGRLVDAGDYTVDPANPVLRVSGRSAGDGYARIFTVVANGVNLGERAWRSGWVDDGGCEHQGIVAIVWGGFSYAFDLSEHLSPEELLLPVDVQVGVSTYVGHWDLHVATA